MFPLVDTKDATAVASFVAEKFAGMYPGASTTWLHVLFCEIEELFTGQRPDYAAIDLRYHDLEHTLQATVCLSLLLQGRHRAGDEPRLGPRDFELALSAVLLHDTGYLKLRSDQSGTGAKYTYCHVLRSCAFAASYLPTLGAEDHEIDIVLNAINCTGPTKEIRHLACPEPVCAVIGSALGTADYLGQMAAPDYPDELDSLYNEFLEADEFVHRPVARRAFKSAADLIERTPAFWKTFVREKIEGEFHAMYRYLAHPYPHGPNAYLDAVEANIAEIARRIAGPTAAVS
jgi:hypothetical protein